MHACLRLNEIVEQIVNSVVDDPKCSTDLRLAGACTAAALART